MYLPIKTIEGKLINGDEYPVYPVKRLPDGTSRVMTPRELELAIRNAPTLKQIKKDSGIRSEDYTDKNGDLYWEIDINGKVYKIYPVDGSGNVISLTGLKKTIERLPQLSKLQDEAEAKGIEFVKNAGGGINFNDDRGMYWQIKGYEKEDLKIYPVSEYGKVMTLEELSLEANTNLPIKNKALENGEHGAYVIAHEDMIADVRKERNKAVAEFIIRHNAEAAEQARLRKDKMMRQVKEQAETRPVWRQFVDWVLSLFGYETQTRAQYIRNIEDAAAGLEYEIPSMAGLTESDIMKALGGVKTVKETKDKKGNTTGKEVMTVVGVKTIKEGVNKGKNIFIYQKEYIDIRDGKEVVAGKEYFSELDGVL